MEISQKVRTIILFILISIAVFSAYKIFSYFYDGYKYEKLNDEIRNQYYEGSEGDYNSGPIFIDDGGEDKFEGLKKINEDIIGWLRIPDTKVNYPVVQAGDNDYYLRRNLWKKYEIRGSIFMDYRSKANAEGLNTIIYGHNMKDGTMFRDISKYKNHNFYTEHPYVIYDYPDERTKWEIFSAYVYEGKEKYFKSSFVNEEEYIGYLKECRKRSLYDTGVEVNEKDKIITLMTCSYEFDGARMVIHAKYID